MNLGRAAHGGPLGKVKPMSLDMRVEITSGVSTIEVPDDVAADLKEAYDALAKLPVNRQISVDFPDKKAASLFARQGKAWAAGQVDENNLPAPLTFARKGDIKGNPECVSFRIYVPRPPKGTAE